MPTILRKSGANPSRRPCALCGPAARHRWLDRRIALMRLASAVM